MQINRYRFTGTFNQFGATEITAPTEDKAWEFFLDIDHGDGYGIADKSEVDKVEDLGKAYEFDGTADEWLAAVRDGSVE